MNSFSLFLALGAALGLYQVYAAAPPKQAAQRVNFAILTLFGALLGARLGYVAMLWGYFRQHPGEILQIWLGGLSLWGALTGAGLTLALLAAVQRVSFASLADVLAPLLPALGAAGWLGCARAGCAYGHPVPAGAWWGLPSADETGLIVRRIPLQEIAALSLVLSYLTLIRRLPPKQQPPSGRLAALYGLIFGAHTLLFSLWIAAPAPRWLFGLFPGALAAGLLAAACALALLAQQFGRARSTGATIQT